MKFLIIILTLIFITPSFCQDTLNSENLTVIFKDINLSDATHIKEPEIRNIIFVENFNTIITIIKNQGYPTFLNNKKNKKLIQSIEHATRRTFIHILQTKPDLLLNERIINLIKNEINQKRINSNTLKIVLKAYQYDQDNGNVKFWNDNVKNNFYLAIKEWNIKLYP